MDVIIEVLEIEIDVIIRLLAMGPVLVDAAILTGVEVELLSMPPPLT